MPLVIQKYGGTSVGTPERIRAIARRVAAARRRGDDVVVVVSAMGDATDELLSLAERVTGGAAPGAAHPREMDMLLTAGERISMALVAMAIREEGAEALSFTGSQAAIITDGAHTAARIIEVRADRVREELAAGRVVIVAGFQGVSVGREVTTLGRGGSDTTAVALAAALHADRCEIYTDVDGVFTADPRRVSDARLVQQISHAEMTELAAAGAQVMHPRAVEIGARFCVDIRVLSSLAADADAGMRSDGTLITHAPVRMEELDIIGITSARSHAKFIVHGLPAGMPTPTELLARLAEAAVPVDVISEHPESADRIGLSVTVWQDALPRARQVVEEFVEEFGGAGWEVREDLARIALVGSGMHGRPGVYACAFRALLEGGVEVHAISTSAISITLHVPADREDAALRALHDAFALGTP
ncbi:MAG: aspartate kinase [Gemmatimonadota bacterium]|nr:aspartate kinase [Gemmatimonadota bacterium]